MVIGEWSLVIMNADLRKRLMLTIAIVVAALSLTGQACTRSSAPTDTTDQALVVWGLWPDSNQLEPVISRFKDATGIDVTYKKISSVASYERDLIQALAEGRGPDVFVIHHNWVNDKRGLLSPAPSGVVDQRAVAEEFVDVVSADLVRDGQVWALPTSVDTLALFYNKDVLNAAGVARPPATWSDFQQMVERVTQVSRVGVIQQSAAALGTAANVNRGGDILQVLLLQSGLPIISDRGDSVSIANDIGERAVTFYTDFANKAKRVFTWNLQQDFSIDAFAEGDTATMVNYSYHIPTVRAKNPRLNFAIAPLPQIIGQADAAKVNLAAYWPWAVSSSTPVPQAAWSFVRFLTSHDQALELNQAQRVPPARRDSILETQRDPELGVFAEQALTAASWPRVDIAATDAVFNQLIDSVVTGSANVGTALERAEDQLTQLQQKDS